MKKYVLFAFIVFSIMLNAQVGIGTTSPNSSSILELQSNSKGILMPRVFLLSTTDEVTVPSPANSLLVYNLSTVNDVTPGFYYWDTVWKPLKTTINPSLEPYWSLAGNTISNADFLGSVNFNPLQLKVNNILFGKFHPNGGISLGYGASANDNNSIAIGTNSNASPSNQATAISPLSTASGYQSTAMGYGATASNNSALALGYQSIASGYQSTAVGVNTLATTNSALAIGNTAQATAYQSSALGTGAKASGQNATALGYQAIASQDNSIVLGSSANADNKVGIGTNSPEERLHIVGQLKLVNGTQGNGFVLTSDSNGKAIWQNQSTINYYGDTYYNGSGQTLNQYTNINFGGNNIGNGVTINSDGITVHNSGNYKITYRVTLSKSSGSAVTTSFNLYKNFNTLLPGSLTAINIGNNDIYTITGSVLTTLNAYDKVSVRSNNSDTNVVYLENGTSLIVELIR